MRQPELQVGGRLELRADTFGKTLATLRRASGAFPVPKSLTDVSDEIGRSRQYVKKLEDIKAGNPNGLDVDALFKYLQSVAPGARLYVEFPQPQHKAPERLPDPECE